MSDGWKAAISLVYGFLAAIIAFIVVAEFIWKKLK